MKTRSRYNEQTELLKSAAILANAVLKTKDNPWTTLGHVTLLLLLLL
jgi:hypothetical protein